MNYYGVYGEELMVKKETKKSKRNNIVVYGR